LHTIVKYGLKLLLVIVCGLVSARFFSYERGTHFGFDRQMLKSRQFWLGALVGVVFLFSDYRFAHYLSLPQ